MRCDRIRLLKFLGLFAIGGTERQFVNLVRRIDGDRFDVHLGCFQRWGEFLHEIEATGRPLTNYTISKLLSYRTFKEQLRLAAYLRHNRIQVLHAYGFYPNVFAIPAAKLAGVPVTIAAIRDTGAHINPGHMRLQRMICGMADCVLVNAEAVRGWLVNQGYRADKIRVIHNGIAVRTNKEQSDFRHEFGIPKDAILIGNICRLQALKGLRYFLEAAAMVCGRYDKVMFVVVGDGSDREPLQGLAKRLGISNKVIFTGFRTDTPGILSELSISVSSSLTEGLSNTLLESLATGVPVVATRVGGNPEIVVDGETGFLAPPRDSKGLANAICRLLENPVLASEMGRAGIQRIKRHFSIEEVVRQTEQLYVDLFKRNTA
ncbi:MAG: glycosyltransferase [Acidobacteria bacterium]|nr:glycosyltransferase [Acidobacteriota bacterium]